MIYCFFFFFDWLLWTMLFIISYSHFSLSHLTGMTNGRKETWVYFSAFHSFKVEVDNKFVGLGDLADWDFGCLACWVRLCQGLNLIWMSVFGQWQFDRLWFFMVDLCSCAWVWWWQCVWWVWWLVVVIMRLRVLVLYYFKFRKKKKKKKLSGIGWKDTTRKTSYCGRFFAMVAKTTAICHTLWRFFGPPLYMRYIAVFHWTAAIDLVFCGILQWWYIKPPQYMCFSGVRLSYSGASSIRHNIYSLFQHTTTTVYKTAAIHKF